MFNQSLASFLTQAPQCFFHFDLICVSKLAGIEYWCARPALLRMFPRTDSRFDI